MRDLGYFGLKIKHVLKLKIKSENKNNSKSRPSAKILSIVNKKIVK